MRRHTLPTVLALVFLVALSGCGSDPTITGTDMDPSAKIVPGDKMRHVRLLDRAKETDPASKNGEMNVKLLIKFSSPTVTTQRIVSRYKIVSRYRIVSRYGFSNVFHGLALKVPESELAEFLKMMEGDPDIATIEPDWSFVTLPGMIRYVVSEGTFEVVPWTAQSVLAHAVLPGDYSKSPVELFVLDTGAADADLNVVDCLALNGTALATCTDSGDKNRHGTEVSGVLAAKDNSVGIRGLAPGARIHVIKALGDDGAAELSNVVAAIDYLAGYKKANPAVPMVANLSFGGAVDTTGYTALDEAIKAATEVGVVFVVAAGNEGIDASTVSPAHTREVITVGSYGKSGSFSSFSNYGEVIDILAPGEDVETLGPLSLPIFSSGTSIAAPHVTAAVVRMLTAEPSLTPQQVRDRLVSEGEASVKSVKPGTTNVRLIIRK